ncbi:hypothetical protein AO390_15360 [Pseudomonas marginalis ICMP 11289]|nr:hypothetical protein AO390_15360 [Pseudomonas marginalis ICMP 11289]
MLSVQLRESGEHAFNGLPEAKVKKSQASLGEHDVFRLYIPMQHAFFVNMCQGVQQHCCDFPCLRPRQSSGIFIEHSIKAHTAHEFKRHEGLVAFVVHAKCIRTNDVRMMKAPCQGKLAVKQRIGVPCRRQVIIEHLDCDAWIRLSHQFVQQVAGLIDDSHAASAKQALDSVAA